MQPASTGDVQRWLQDDLTQTIQLGSARENNVVPTTWH
jgi:hypothetical protein